LTRKVGKPPQHIHKDEEENPEPQLEQDTMFEEQN